MLRYIYLAASLAFIARAEEVEASEEKSTEEKFFDNYRDTICYIVSGLEYFDIYGLKNGNGKDAWSVISPASGLTYQWSFCHYEAYCAVGENRAEDISLGSASIGTIAETGQCALLSSDLPHENLYSTFKHSENDKKNSLKITYTNGDKCLTDSARYQQLTIDLLCSNQETSDAVLLEDDPCHAHVQIQTKYGCPKFSPTAIVQFLHDNPWILGFVLILFGSVVCFYGRKFLQYTLFAVGFLIGFLGSAVIFSFLSLFDGLRDGGAWPITLAVIMLLISLGLGALLGFFLFRTYETGAQVLGAVGGVLGMLSLYNLVFYGTQSFWLMLLMTIAGAVLGVLLTIRYFDIVLMLSTSMIGAYSLVRGVSVFAGGYPNELVLLNQLSEGLKPQLENSFYIYIGVMIVLLILGFLRQKKTLDEEEGDGFEKQA